MPTDKPPVSATGAKVVRARTDAVWDLIANIDAWPSWNPDVQSAQLSGNLEPGTTFDWKAGPGTIHSELTVVAEPSTISWTGSMPGIRANHTWKLEATEQGTQVTTEETWTGVLPRFFPRSMTRNLQKAIDNGLEAISGAVENRYGTQT
jgi:hypothetical protein